MNDGARLLVVDDDDDIRSLLRELLTRAGFQVDEAADGRTALRRLFEAPPELVILDVSMPDLDGYATLERIRDLSDVPVIMLTARTQELERVRGLTTGADDYVAKPFGLQELLARVKAVLRRRQRVHERVEFGDVVIDLTSKQVTRAGEAVELTAQEFRFLAYLAGHPGAIA